jgi:hypothetical protein
MSSQIEASKKMGEATKKQRKTKPQAIKSRDVDNALNTLSSLHSPLEGVHHNTPVDTSSSSESSVWDAIQELETDPDYIEWVREVWQPLFKDECNICAEKAFLQWRSQGGVCAATGTVLVGVAGGKGMYSPALVAVNPNRPLSEKDNCKFVVNCGVYDAFVGAVPPVVGAVLEVGYVNRRRPRYLSCQVTKKIGINKG